jgi:hypothetical protein
MISELLFRSYAHQRITFPHIAPERWAAIFPDQAEMEEMLICLLLAAGEVGHA